MDTSTRKSDAEMLGMLQRAQVETIVAASAAVETARVECMETRFKVDRLQRELDKARDAQEQAIAKRDEAAKVVHRYVREYAALEQSPDADAIDAFKSGWLSDDTASRDQKIANGLAAVGHARASGGEG